MIPKYKWLFVLVITLFFGYLVGKDFSDWVALTLPAVPVGTYALLFIVFAILFGKKILRFVRL